MTAYYNENDPKAAAWLRELIKAGHITQGEVDERSIEDVIQNDIKGFTQCHFFAGIGGWSYALRLAGWSDDRPVWTGSCPCQPFSTAGARGGFADERHLWPAFYHLVAQCKPTTIFGEQVASALAWLDLVQADLEASGYSFGAADICAAGVGAPHIRQRAWWVANSASDGREWEWENGSIQEGWQPKPEHSGQLPMGFEGSSVVSGMGNSIKYRLQRRTNQDIQGARRQDEGREIGCDGSSSVTWIKCADGKTRPTESGTFPLAHGVPARVVRLRGYGNAIVPQVAAMFIKSYGA